GLRLERSGELQPVGLAFRAVADAGLVLPLGAEQPAVLAGVLDRRADREGAATVAVGRIHLSGGIAVGVAALVVADLLVGVTADTHHPAVAQAPAEGVVGVQLAAGLVVGVLVLE